MPLVWLALGFVAGLLLSQEWPPPLAALLLLVASLGAAHLLLRSAGIRLGLSLLLVVGVLLGLARAGPGVLDPPGQLHAYHDERVQLQGLVADLPELSGGRLRFMLDAESVRPGTGVWVPVEGGVLVSAGVGVEPVPGRSFPFVSYGDQIVLEGVVRTSEPFGGFDYPRHLASQGIGSVLSNGEISEVRPSVGGTWWLAQVHRARSALAGSLARVLPEPQAALGQALLLGLRGGLPSNVQDQFRRAGAAHLLAISGLHVGVLLALAIAVSQASLGRRRGLYLLAPLFLMWAYVLLAGASPSVVRAGIMGSAYLLALATGRATTPLNALATLLMLAWDPRWLWHLSFQLSFAAMAGVLVIGVPAWQRLRALAWGGAPSGWRPWLWDWGTGGVLISAGAILRTLPLVALNFHQLPLLGILATLLILPVLPGLLLGGFIAALLGLAWGPLGWLAAWAVLALGSYTLFVIDTLSRIPGAVVDASGASAAWAWAYYALVVAILATLARRRWLPGLRTGAARLWTGPDQPAWRAFILMALVPMVLVPWLLALARPDGLTHLYFLDVGQGDAALVRTPGGYQVLLDGGPDGSVTLPLVDGLLPAGRGIIDLAVLSHPDADHMTGLLVLAQRGRIRAIVVPPVVDPQGDLWRRQLASTGVRLVEGVAGVTVRLPDGVELAVLHPPVPPIQGTSADINNNGLVVRLTVGDASVLFSGDIEAPAEQLLLDGGVKLSAQVLKLAHHGSPTSSSLEFLQAVAPAAAIVSVGAANPFGHPSTEVLKRVEVFTGPDQLYDTRRHGTVELITDGTSWWVEAPP